MHELARLSAEERGRLIDDFWDAVFGGAETDPGFEARLRSARPELPDDPGPEQVDAWVELATLAGDEAFRATVRTMTARGPADPAAARARSALVADRAGAALEAGIDPASAAARPLADELAAALLGPERAGDPAARAALADELATFSDARVERFWRLLAVVNGWGEVASTRPAYEWTIAALRG